MWAFLTYSPHLYSTFNALFNIQLRIQHSTIHFIFNSFFAPSIIYSTISTNYSILKHSTIHSTFNSFEPSLLLVSDTDSLLGKNVAAARMPATKIEAYEDDTRLHFDVESGPPRFLGSVLQRIDHRWVHVYSPEASRRYKLLSNNRFWEKKKQQILYNL